MERVREVNKVYLITVAAAVMASFFIGAFPIFERKPLLSLLFSQVVYAVPMLVYLGKTSENPLKALRIKPFKTMTIVFLVVFAYLITPVLNLINAVSMLFSENVINNALAGIIGGYPLWVGIAAIALIPGILEECVYRGVFFNEYRKVNPLWGIFISGLLFGLMHMNFNQFFYAFVMGVIFALLVEATDSLLSSMLVHFTINATSVVLSRQMEDIVTVVDKEELLVTIPVLIVPALVTAALAFCVLYFITRLEGRSSVIREMFSKENKKGETVVTPPLLFGMGICFFLMLFMELSNRFL